MVQDRKEKSGQRYKNLDEICIEIMEVEAENDKANWHKNHHFRLIGSMTIIMVLVFTVFTYII